MDICSEFQGHGGSLTCVFCHQHEKLVKHHIHLTTSSTSGPFLIQVLVHIELVVKSGALS